MDIRTLNDGLSVCPQIAASDMPAIAAAGFRTVICNRPDGEGEDQPAQKEIAAAAKAAGIAFRYIPVVSGAMTTEDVVAFGAALRAAPAPVLAYCRSGSRSAALAVAAGAASA